MSFEETCRNGTIVRLRLFCCLAAGKTYLGAPAELGNCRKEGIKVEWPVLDDMLRDFRLPCIPIDATNDFREFLARHDQLRFLNSPALGRCRLRQTIRCETGVGGWVWCGSWGDSIWKSTRTSIDSLLGMRVYLHRVTIVRHTHRPKI